MPDVLNVQIRGSTSAANKPPVAEVQNQLKVVWQQKALNAGSFLVGGKSDKAGDYTGTVMIYFTVRYRP